MRAERAAAAVGVTIKALRYYESYKLLKPVRLANGYRDYSPDDVRLAAAIRELMSFGLCARETRPFLDCLHSGHDDPDDCPESLAAYQDKIDRLDRLIARLVGNREELSRRMNAAARRGFRLDPETGEERSMLPRPDPLPDDLPPPTDDGAAAHLPGLWLPPLAFTATDGQRVRLDEVSTGRWVLFLYPLTGEPGVDMPRGWDQIPGARGCSQEACGFRDAMTSLQAHGVQRVLGLSTDRTEYQQDLVRRLHLPYPMLADPELSLARALQLPTFEAFGTRLYKRLTLMVSGARIDHVFYPIFPPDRHADEVLQWLLTHPVLGSTTPSPTRTPTWTPHCE